MIIQRRKVLSFSSILCLIAIGAAIGILLACGTARADGFDTMRQAWFNKITGGASQAQNDLIVLTATRQINVRATQDWTLLRAAKPFRTTCFSNLTFGTSRPVTEAFRRLNTMARAYWARGGTLYGNTAMRADIIAALDWMYANAYNEKTKEAGNWWDWEIGSPLNLNDVIVLMYDFLTPTQIANDLLPIDHFALKYTGGSGGANGAWVAIVTAVRAVTLKDRAKLAYARNRLSALTSNVTSGDGFYGDGSYIGHGWFCYNGGYGLYFLQSLADGYFLMGPGTPSPMPDSKRAVAYNWVKNSYWTLMYGGQVPYFSIGREVGRGPSGNRSGTVCLCHLAAGRLRPECRCRTAAAYGERSFYRRKIILSDRPWSDWTTEDNDGRPRDYGAAGREYDDDLFCC